MAKDKAAQAAAKADAKAAKAEAKSVEQNEKSQIQNLKAAQKAESIALKATLKNAGLTGGALNQALKAEKQSNKAELGAAKSTLGQAGLQQLSSSGPSGIRSSVGTYGGGTYGDDVESNVSDVIDRAANVRTQYNLAPVSKSGNVTMGVGLDKLTKLELSRDPETGEYTKQSPLTKLLAMGDMYVGKQFTAEDLAANNVKLKQDKNNPNLYKLAKGNDNIKNFVYFNQNPDGTYTGVGINRRVIEDTSSGFEKFMASDLGKALSIGAAIFAPQIGSYLYGLAPGSIGASMAGAATLGAGKAALSGGDFTDIATAALTSGATSGVGQTTLAFMGDLASSMKNLVPFESTFDPLADAYGSTAGAYGLPADQISGQAFDTLADTYGNAAGAYGLPAEQISTPSFDRIADVYGSTEGAYGLPAEQISTPAYDRLADVYGSQVDPYGTTTRAATPLSAPVPEGFDRLADVYGSSEGAYGLPAEQVGAAPIDVRDIPFDRSAYEDFSGPSGLAKGAFDLAEAGWGALPSWAQWGLGLAAVDALTGSNIADALTGKGGGGGGGLSDEQKADIDRLKELYGENLDLLGYQRGRTGDPESYARYGEIGGEHEFFTPREFVKLDTPTTTAATGGYMTSDNSLPYYRYGQMPMATGGPAYFKSGALAQGADGRSDDIPAVLSDGEYVFDAETVALLGNGSSDAGAQRLEQMRQQIRKHKGENLARGQISPDARSPLSYLKG